MKVSIQSSDRSRMLLSRVLWLEERQQEPAVSASKRIKLHKIPTSTRATTARNSREKKQINWRVRERSVIAKYKQSRQLQLSRVGVWVEEPNPDMPARSSAILIVRAPNKTMGCVLTSSMQSVCVVGGRESIGYLNRLMLKTLV